MPCKPINVVCASCTDTISLTHLVDLVGVHQRIIANLLTLCASCTDTISLTHLVDLVGVHQRIKGGEQLIQVGHHLVGLHFLAHGGKAHNTAQQNKEEEAELLWGV